MAGRMGESTNVWGDLGRWWKRESEARGCSQAAEEVVVPEDGAVGAETRKADSRHRSKAALNKKQLLGESAYLSPAGWS